MYFEIFCGKGTEKWWQIVQWSCRCSHSQTECQQQCARCKINAVLPLHVIWNNHYFKSTEVHQKRLSLISYFDVRSRTLILTLQGDWREKKDTGWGCWQSAWARGTGCWVHRDSQALRASSRQQKQRKKTEWNTSQHHQTWTLPFCTMCYCS